MLFTTNLYEDYPGYFTLEGIGTVFDSSTHSYSGAACIKIFLYNSSSDEVLTIDSIMITPKECSDEYVYCQPNGFYNFESDGTFLYNESASIYPVTVVKSTNGNFITAKYNRDVGKVISELQTTIAKLT